MSGRIVATIGGIPNTRHDVLVGLVNHLPAIRHLWPAWGKSNRKFRVTAAVERKMAEDRYPEPTDFQGYAIYPPDSFSDKEKWDWLVELLVRCGEVARQADVTVTCEKLRQSVGYKKLIAEHVSREGGRP